MSIAVIAGLGNPGRRYRGTRHNAGFAVVDRSAERAGERWSRDRRAKADVATLTRGAGRALLAKPRAYMNASGGPVAALLRYRRLGPGDLLVVHDDVALPLGRSKLTRRGGAGGHNGVADVLTRVGEGFYRLRVGIGAKPRPEMDLADYVLGAFDASERPIFEAALPRLAEQLEMILDRGPEHAMNTINQRTPTNHEPTNPNDTPV